LYINGFAAPTTRRPAALHRLPESIAHIAEALWMQALEEAKHRAVLEKRDSSRLAELDKQRLEVRSHVLSLREGELDSRLRDPLESKSKRRSQRRLDPEKRAKRTAKKRR
jgi:hypothetical protein